MIVIINQGILCKENMKNNCYWRCRIYSLHIIEKLLDMSHDLFIVDDFSTSEVTEFKKVELITGKSVNYAEININKTEKLVEILESLTLI